MATLHVENVPDDLYEALRKRTKRNRKSNATEVIELLRQFVPAEEELKHRHEFYFHVLEMREQKPLSPGPFPSTEEMLREDRER